VVPVSLPPFVYRTGLLILLILITGYLHSQNRISGKVFDAGTSEPLAFVNITINEGKTGGTSDIDGKFTLISDEPVILLRLSYVGYETRTVTVENPSKSLSIYLKKKEIELSEVTIVAGENPAHRIIKLVLENRFRNDPEKVASFSYTSYDKMVFTADTLNAPAPAPNMDTLTENLRKYLEKRNFFMMETVSERKFMAPSRNYEKVVATKISGFKDPIFVFLISQIQSTSFYKEIIKIGGRNFINPISDGSLQKYFFSIEDTTYTNHHDTVFIISFHPYKETNFDGLKGVLSINSNGWAIQNVLAEPHRENEGMQISIEQMYELKENRQWFPVQFNVDLVLRNMKVNNYSIMANGRSYIRNVELNPELVKRQFNHIDVDVDPKAGDRDEIFWNAYRVDSLTQKDLETYRFIDSTSKAEGLEKRMRTFLSLINGKIPLGVFSLDINRIIHYNEYEKLFLGIGGSTNRKFSQWMEAGGYWGYGFGDKASKYGLFTNITIDRFKELRLHFSYSNDLEESAGCNRFSQDQNLLQPENYRNLLLTTFDLNEKKNAVISFRTFKYFRFKSSVSQYSKKPLYDYQYLMEGNTTRDAFHFFTLSAGFRFAWKEKFLKTPSDLISLGSKYPIVQFEYTHGYPNIAGGETTFDRFDMQVRSSWYIRYIGQSRLNLTAGWINGAVPYSELYNGHGSYRSFTIFTPMSFNTMGMNEFTADRYLNLFYTYESGKLLFRSGRFQPEPALALHAGFGWLNDKTKNHHLLFGESLKEYSKGYFESGLLFFNLLNLRLYRLGAGIFYRFGAYARNQSADNFSYRFSVTFPMQ